MTVYAYGISASDFESRINGMKITATSSPSTAAVTAMVGAAAAVVNGRLRAIGIDPDTLAVTSEAWAIARECVYKFVIADLTVLRQRDENGMASGMRSDANKMLEAISTEPQRMGTGASDEIGVKTWREYERETRQHIRRHASLGERLATRNKV